VLTVPAKGQDTIRTTRFDDVVFAISFSPDGRTLAIARGSNAPVHRFGRIELWDCETLKLRHIIKGFDGPIASISFSPDGHTLISSSGEFRSSKLQQKARSRDGSTLAELKWWDTRTGELKQKLSMPDERSYSIRAIQSPDGKQLALAKSSLELRPILYFPPFGSPGLNPMESPVLRMYLSPLSMFKVEMKLVDAESGKLRFKLDMDNAGAASFAPDGGLLAVANGKHVRLWNPQTGKEVGKLKDLRGTANAVAFSPDGRTLAVASIRYQRVNAKDVIKIIGISEVKLFDISTGKVNLTLSDLGAVNSLVFSREGRILVAGGVLPPNNSDAAGLSLIDLETGKARILPIGADYKEAVDSLVLSQDGGLLAFRSGSATVRLLDTRSGTLKQTWDADSVGDAAERPASRFLLSVKRVVAVAFLPDGTTVSGESDEGEIKFWDRRTGEVKRRLNAEQDDALLVAASMDGKSFAEVSQGKVLLWHANSDAKRIVPLPGPQAVSALALSADGALLAVGHVGGVTLFSSSGEVARELGGQEGLVNRLAFSHDGRALAGADEDGTIRVWNVASGRIERTLLAPGEITALVFAPNGESLATAAADNSISLWNLKTGLPQAKFQKHEAAINALAFSPNGQLLASGSDDRTIVLWEVVTGKSKRTFKGHDQTVAALAFSQDGQLLASGSGNASVVLWEVETGKLSRVLR
jgi:WD40 repeat protein